MEGLFSVLQAKFDSSASALQNLPEVQRHGYSLRLDGASPCRWEPEAAFRVAPEAHASRAPTDPGMRISRIRLLAHVETGDLSKKTEAIALTLLASSGWVSIADLSIDDPNPRIRTVVIAVGVTTVAAASRIEGTETLTRGYPPRN